MEKSMIIILGFLLVLMAAAAIFYTNPGENHRTVAISLCELQCHNLTSSQLMDNYCVSKNISFGYACAISSGQSQSICNVSSDVYINTNCQLLGTSG